MSRSVAAAAMSAAIFLGWSGSALAADFEISFDLPQGSKLHVDMTKTAEREKAGQSLKLDMSFRYLEELVPSDKGYVVTQTLVDSKLPPEAMDIAGVMTAAKRIVFDADVDLSPTKVRDQQALVDAVVGSFADMMKGEAPANVIETTKAQMKTLYGSMSPEAAANAFLREYSLLEAPQMLSLDLGKPLGGEFEVANPAGAGAPIKRTQTYELKSVDKANHQAVIEFSDKIDPEGLKAAALSMMQRLAPGAPQPTPAEMATIKMEQSTTCRYEMDTATGLTAKADCTITRSAVDESGKPDRRVEHTVMTQRLEKP